ncbi:hypothetical protein ACHAPT_011936 [Fusarium lateritium]
MVLYNKSLEGKLGGQITHSFCTVMDILPTLLDLAGVPVPTSPYKGREIETVRGVSWRPVLEGRASEFHSPDHIVGRELNGSAALHKGHWHMDSVPRYWGDSERGVGNSG